MSAAAARIVAVLMLWAAGSTGAEVRSLVLVAGADAKLAPLPEIDVRRLFLGEPVRVGNRALVPLINATDPLLYEVFLQKVVFMSARTFEHRLLSRVFRFGGRRPQRFTRTPALLEALRQGPETVSFMWRSDVQQAQELQIVQELWRGSVD